MIISLLTISMTYSVLVIGHILVHKAWFKSNTLSRITFWMCSVTTLQSMTEYRLSHVKNHHRYNNDRSIDGAEPKDMSTTFLGTTNKHQSLLDYAVKSACSSLGSWLVAMLSVHKGWAVFNKGTKELLGKEGKTASKNKRYMQIERAIVFVHIILLVSLAPSTALVYVTVSFFLTLCLVNIQNFYEHFGALPENKYADSVSCYNKLYNFLTFNDGYHQEHHYKASTHWTKAPLIRRELDSKNQQRIVSPLPALLGMFDHERKRLEIKYPANTTTKNYK
nr:fatty acid desaturase [Pseudoalteromonas luteoviolacea]